MPRPRVRFPGVEALEAALALDLHPVVGADEIDAAAVICLRAGPRGEELLVCRRAVRWGDPWSGHMGLPGGRREPVDADALATAVRETEEEVGFDLRTVGRILGALPVLETRREAFHVRVAIFVARVDPNVEPLVSDELAAAWWVRLDDLRRTRVRVPEVPVPVPAYLAPAPAGPPAVVWGMTFRMLAMLRGAEGLVPPSTNPVRAPSRVGRACGGRRHRGGDVATTDPDGRHAEPPAGSPTPGRAARFEELARARRRMALILTAAMLVVYFGFIALVAWGKETMGEEVVDGLSVGILLGVITIIAVFVLTLFYARWANAHEIELEENRRS